MKSKRKIAIFTGNRSEYGIFSPIIKHIEDHLLLDYYLIASGAHLEKDFGLTIENIKKDGFKIYKKILLKKRWEMSNIRKPPDLFLINQNSSIKKTLKKIDKNQWGIVFAIDNQKKLNGVVTDGDIRRALLHNLPLSLSISKVMNKELLFIRSSWDNEKINNLLNSKITKSKTSLSGSLVLPVLNKENRVVKIIHANRDSLYRSNSEIGVLILELSDLLRKLRPDFLLCYGDRYETFAAAISSSQMAIPTVHIEGGDITAGGALDDSIRHAITKLAHLHLVTNKDSYKRVVALGEESWRVHNIGYPVLDLIKQGNFASKKELKKKFNINPNKPLVVFIQHAITTEIESSPDQIKPSLNALSSLAKRGITIIIIYPNNDAGNRAIIKEVRALKSKKIPNIHVFKNLDRYYFHGLLNVCGRTGKGLLAGNSSSGIKESPAFGCPAVNIGSREDKRLRAKNIIDVCYKKREIVKAIKKCLFDETFRKKCRDCKNPYDVRDSGKLVAKILATIKIDQRLIQKGITY